MKLAVSGKGGTGKTTLAAALAHILSRQAHRVILIDADPDMNLQVTLGLQGIVKPLVEMKELIQERTETKPGGVAPVFKLNPTVDDIPEKYFLRQDNLLFAIMGTVRGGGLGCTCPENAFLKALLRHLVLRRKEIVILDMEAG
ncbi:MAG: AAA family ATPase, partial [Candidatus Omnitrophica bacterium]|nr:AAA family ATPase [Candidatus Omnitrophota bacterium]